MRDYRAELLLFEAADDSMGIYPKEVVSEGIVTPRTEHQTGWNRYAIELSERREKLRAWFAQLPRLEYHRILDLLEAEILLLGIDENGDLTLHLIMNDIFVPVADTEKIEVSDIASLWRPYVGWDLDGVIAWVGKRTGIDPRAHHITQKYKEARAFLDRLAEPSEGE